MTSAMPNVAKPRKVEPAALSVPRTPAPTRCASSPAPPAARTPRTTTSASQMARSVSGSMIIELPFVTGETPTGLIRAVLRRSQLTVQSRPPQNALRRHISWSNAYACLCTVAQTRLHSRQLPLRSCEPTLVDETVDACASGRSRLRRQVRRETPEPRNPGTLEPRRSWSHVQGLHQMSDLESAGRAEALEMLSGVVERSRRSDALGVPNSFVRSDDGFTPTPLVRLIRGGRGGGVRLKIHLTMMLIATRSPHHIRTPFTHQAWARLLNLSVEDGAARRVADALRWLEQQGFIEREPRQGNTPLVKLLDPATRQPFERPNSHFFKVPLDVWRKGWILDLSARGLSLLLVLLDLCPDSGKARYATRFRKDCYGLSSDTWTRARAELEAHKILEVGRAPQGSDFDPERMRNTYTLRYDILSREAGVEDLV